MTYDPARPRYTLPFAGKEYELVGSFAVIEAAENALKDNIVNISVRTIDMPASDAAKLCSAVLKACDHDVSTREAAGTIWEMGAASNDFTILRMHLHAFLRICVSRPSDREEAAKKMGEMIGKWTARSASPGETTGDSA